MNRLARNRILAAGAAAGLALLLAPVLLQLHERADYLMALPRLAVVEGMAVVSAAWLASHGWRRLRRWRAARQRRARRSIHV